MHGGLHARAAELGHGRVERQPLGDELRLKGRAGGCVVRQAALRPRGAAQREVRAEHGVFGAEDGGTTRSLSYQGTLKITMQSKPP